MTVTIIEKHPWAQIRIGVDWATYLFDSAGATVVSAVWIDQDGVLTFPMENLDGFVSSTIIDGGVDGGEYYVENRATFSDGSRDVTTVVVIVTDKRPA